jgi:glycosyltransferase involved in cell wall biosynthesis
MDIGGTELHVFRVATHLDRARFAPIVVTLRGCGPLRQSYEDAAVPVHACEVRSLKRLHTIPQMVQLARFFSAHDVHLVHTHDIYTNVFAVLAARLARVPAVIASRRWSHRLVARSYRLANAATFRLADAVVANSSSAADELSRYERLAPHRIYTIPSFVRDEAFAELPAADVAAWRGRHGIPAGTVVIGCVARLRPEKDHATLLEAFAGLRESGRDVHLVLVGDGPLRERLSLMCKVLQIADHVTFTGLLPPLPNPNGYFDVVTLASRSESFPNSVVEGMAAARPIVATAVGGVPDLIRDGETGLLVPPGDALQLRAALARLAADPALATRLGAAGRDLVLRHHGVQTGMDALQGAYADVFASSRARAKVPR